MCCVLEFSSSREILVLSGVSKVRSCLSYCCLLLLKMFHILFVGLQNYPYLLVLDIKLPHFGPKRSFKF